MSSDASEDRRLEAWLRRLTWALGRMAAPEREEIVKETRTHLAERLEAGQSVDDALAGFGPAEAYARRFLDEMELSGALGSRRSGELLSVIARRAHRSLVAALAFLVVLFLGGFAGGAVVAAVYKLVDPVRTGLWMGPHEFFIGQIDDPSKAHELLGQGIYPFAIIAVALSWVIGRLVLIWAVRTIRGR